MTAKERLLSQEALVNLIIEHKFIPQKSAQDFNVLLCALRELQPSAKFDPGCSGCMIDIAQSAKRLIEQIKYEGLTFRTFPKQ